MAELSAGIAHIGPPPYYLQRLGSPAVCLSSGSARISLCASPPVEISSMHRPHACGHPRVPGHHAVCELTSALGVTAGRGRRGGRQIGISRLDVPRHLRRRV